jgi:hypothetical protein
VAATGATGLHDQLVQCHSGYRLYRGFNVALLAVTPGFLFAVGPRHVWGGGHWAGHVVPALGDLRVFAREFGCLALSCSLLLLVFALAERRP